MPTLGIIGSGNIGGPAVARVAVVAEMNVVIGNSLGPESLQELIAELGPLAKAGTVDDAAKLGDAVVLSIPLKAVPDLSEGLLRGKRRDHLHGKGEPVTRSLAPDGSTSRIPPCPMSSCWTPTPARLPRHRSALNAAVRVNVAERRF